MGKGFLSMNLSTAIKENKNTHKMKNFCTTKESKNSLKKNEELRNLCK